MHGREMIKGVCTVVVF